MRRTPLYDSHVALGARIIEFEGWQMPVQYSGIIEEHLCVRSRAGVFDVSHMGELVVCGRNALAMLQYLTSNDVSRLTVGQAQYSMILNEKGGVVDDLIVYQIGDYEYLLCVNASNTAKVHRWLIEHNMFDAEIVDSSEDFAQIALQGPLSVTLLARVLGVSEQELSPQLLKPFRFRTYNYPTAGIKIFTARTGYTGEDGFEIYGEPQGVVELWSALLKLGEPLGLKPIGLGARDSLRLEAALPLYGHELGDDISALASGKGWAIKFEKGSFLGRDALLLERQQGSSRLLVGFEVVDPGIVRNGARLFDENGVEIGWVTSGTKCPTIDKAIGMAYVDRHCTGEGAEYFAEVRGRRLLCRSVRLPFYKRPMI